MVYLEKSLAEFGPAWVAARRNLLERVAVQRQQVFQARLDGRTGRKHLFRADTVGHAFTMYAGMFGAHGIALRPENITLIKPTEILFLVLGTAIVIAPKLEVRLRRVSWGPMAETVALSVISVIVMQARTESPFLYFQF